MEEEIFDLLEAPKYYATSPLQKARDELILHILYGTGLRVSELITLEKDQLILGEKQFSIRGKGSKVRSVFLTSFAMEKLLRYLDMRGDLYSPLFISLSKNSF